MDVSYLYCFQEKKTKAARRGSYPAFHIIVYYILSVALYVLWLEALFYISIKEYWLTKLDIILSLSVQISRYTVWRHNVSKTKCVFYKNNKWVSNAWVKCSPRLYVKSYNVIFDIWHTWKRTFPAVFLRIFMYLALQTANYFKWMRTTIKQVATCILNKEQLFTLTSLFSSAIG